MLGNFCHIKIPMITKTFNSIDKNKTYLNGIQHNDDTLPVTLVL